MSRAARLFATLDRIADLGPLRARSLVDIQSVTERRGVALQKNRARSVGLGLYTQHQEEPPSGGRQTDSLVVEA